MTRLSDTLTNESAKGGESDRGREEEGEEGQAEAGPLLDEARAGPWIGPGPLHRLRRVVAR